MNIIKILTFVAISIYLATSVVVAATEDLGNGFRHHGIATSASNHRGIVATKDGEGRDIVLTWLMDHRGCYELLLLDVTTGKSEEYPIPAPTKSDAPFASILSHNNRFYTHFGSHFFEFDPAQRKFTFVQKTAPRVAMSMTEDDKGVIWSASYPKSGLVSFNPKTGEFKDYGYLYAQNWVQYPNYIAADDTGFIYIGVGNASGQIVAVNSVTGKAIPLLAEEERKQGSGAVYRDINGKVYGSSGGPQPKWMELYSGQRVDLPKPPRIEKKIIAAGRGGIFHSQFPDGKVLKEFDTINRVMLVEDTKINESKQLTFDYDSEGAYIMGMCAAPNNTMCGGTGFPMRFFCFNPKTDTWDNHKALLQFNTVTRQGDRWYTGGYGHGVLLEWNPKQPWVNTKKNDEKSNPEWLADAAPDIYRPSALLAYPDGKTLILAGTPSYGFTGGGLLFWDREKKQPTLMKHMQILPQHSTMSLTALDNGKILGGTTIAAGTGGEVKASVAELYIMDMESKTVEWHAPLLPEVTSYTSLVTAPNGLVYGFANSRIFFVFNPKVRNIIYKKDIKSELGLTNIQQGPRVFVVAPDNTIYILLEKGIAKLDTTSFAIKLVAHSPVPVGAGGDYLDGRIYFGSGSHMYSWQVPIQ